MPKYYYNPVSDIIEQTPVLDYNDRQLFPSAGSEAYIYLDKSTNYVYKWTGTQYVLINNYKYTGTTTRQVGGIRSGVLLQNVELEKVVKVLLQPEEINTFTVTGNPTLKAAGKLEVGASIVQSNAQPTINFEVLPLTSGTTEVELKYNGKAGIGTTVNFSLNIPISNTLILSGSSGTNTAPTAAHYSEIPGFISFRAKRIDSIGQEYFSSEIKYEWAYKNIIFQHSTGDDNLSSIPTSDRVTIADNSIVGVLEKVQRITTANASAPRYLYILLPDNYGVISSMRSGGFEVPFITRTSLYSESRTVENRTFNVSYRVYRSFNPFSGSLTIDIS